MKYIFFIATFNAFFFTILLLQKKARALHDHILIGWLIYLGVFTGLYADRLFTEFSLLSGPVYLFYVGRLGARLVYQQAAGVYTPQEDCGEFRK